MDLDSDQFRKLFIGGLHLQTTDQSLKSFYEKWGEVVDCIVMKDPTTKKSRGFGFITYSAAHMVDDCLAERPHSIDGKQVDPKRAMPREDSNRPEMHMSIKKVFIGGIRDQVEEDDMKTYFSQFGNVESVDIIKDKEGKKKGFAFMTFDDTDTVDKIVLIRNHEINGVRVEVKKAMDKNEMRSMPSYGGGRGGRGSSRGGGMPAGGRGGYNSRMGGYDDYGGYGGYSGYGDGYGYGPTGYGQNGGASGWGQSTYTGNGYGGGSSGYSSGYGGGAMKGGGYTHRAAGPYGGNSYGNTSTGGYAGYGYSR